MGCAQVPVVFDDKQLAKMEAVAKGREAQPASRPLPCAYARWSGATCPQGRPYIDCQQRPEGKGVRHRAERCTAKMCKFWKASKSDKAQSLLPRADPPNTVVAKAGKKAMLLWWGFKGSMKALEQSLTALGFAVTLKQRGTKTWGPETVQWVRENRPALLVTWQRFYRGTIAAHVKEACNEVDCKTLVLDFGLWPHYGSSFIDPEGENSTSQLVGQLDALEAQESYREAATRMLPRISEVRRTLLDRASVAESRLPELGLAGIPAGFTFLCLQRTGDLVLRYDADKKYADMWGVLRTTANTLRASHGFCVAKTHPLDKDVKVPEQKLDGPNWRILCKEQWTRFDKRPPDGGDNDQIFAWLLVNCAHFVTVNSTATYQAMALGKPISCLGRGWFSDNGVVAEVASVEEATRIPATNPGRIQRFLAHLYARSLTIEECGTPEVVRDLIERYYPGLTAPKLPEGSAPAGDSGIIQFTTTTPAVVPPMAAVPLNPSNVTAFIINWRRPSISKTIDSIRAGGVENIWVWSNEHEASLLNGQLAHATRVFESKDNVGNWQRFALAGIVDTDYVLFCDDDCIVTPAGMTALLEGAKWHPGKVVGLWGCRWTPPFDHYRKREEYRGSDDKEQAHVVDMVSPWGMIAPKLAIQEAWGKTKYWRVSEDIFKVHTCDDLPLSIAMSECECGRPLIVPCADHGFSFLKESRCATALGTDKKRVATLYACLPRFIEAGWAPFYKEHPEKLKVVA